MANLYWTSIQTSSLLKTTTKMEEAVTKDVLAPQVQITRYSTAGTTDLWTSMNGPKLRQGVPPNKAALPSAEIYGTYGVHLKVRGVCCENREY